MRVIGEKKFCVFFPLFPVFLDTEEREIGRIDEEQMQRENSRGEVTQFIFPEGK
jgi:hypothetical protein